MARCKPPTKTQVDTFRKKVKRELGLSNFWVFPSSATGDLHLSMLEVPKGSRGAGLGSKALDRVVDFAENHGMRIVLQPASFDPHHGTTSRSRLVKFYKRNGFIQNKGRRTDYTMPAGSMYRDPVEGRCERRR